MAREKFKPHFKVHAFLLDVKSLMYSYAADLFSKKSSYRTELAELTEKCAENALIPKNASPKC